MRREAGVGEHAPGVAAHREHAARLDGVVLVQDETVFLGGEFSTKSALVDHRLAIVLALGLQAVQLEQAVGGGEEVDVAHPRRHGRIGEGDGTVFHQARVGEAAAAGEVQEVVPVQRAAQAFAV
jgi:hypothetical protein